MRYALYLTPPKGSALERAAAAWLGRSAFDSAAATSTPDAPDLAAIASPARYGFHATLRAPFRLREGASEADLIAACQAAAPPAVAVPLAVAPLSHFLALVTDRADLVDPAASAALALCEPFRAPLDDAERARRGADRLDARGRALLERWGYPHTEERFTFHMTLSGALDAADRARVQAAAVDHFAAALAAPATLVHALFREDAPRAPFRVLTVLSPPSTGPQP